MAFRAVVNARSRLRWRRPMEISRSLSVALQAEPQRPNMKTEVPGPRSQQLQKELSVVQESGGVQFFIDYDHCQGNFITDADGNVILDLFTQIASIPVGYNHPRVIEAFTDPKNQSAFVNRPAMGVFPGADHVQRIHQTLMSVAPPGLKNVQTMACGACSVEHSQKAMFMSFQRRKRGGAAASEEDLQTCLKNQPPGCPHLAILSFNNAFHGRTMGALALTHTKWAHKLDFPQPDWPVADFPLLQYPLDQHVKENAKEEQRCLDMVRDLMYQWERKGHPVAGIAVEPIQSEGGDNHASPAFFQGLQDIVREHGASLMLDEVQTGCAATGKFWAHEHFNLREPPDVVPFAKKMLTGGFFVSDELRPKEPFRIFNTWVGDPSKLVLLEAVVDVIKSQRLLDSVTHIGHYMLNGLVDLQTRFPGLVSRARGLGLLAAVDLPSPAVRDKVLAQLLNRGVNVGSCGVNTLRLRPTLTVQQWHVDIFFDIFDDVLKNVK